MKKIIALLFILIMCGPLLPALLPVTEQQQTVLLSLTEEEHSKEKKEKKEAKECFLSLHSISSFLYLTSSFPHTNEAITEPPYLGYTTPPPNVTC
jgi:hypothetical protein